MDELIDKIRLIRRYIIFVPFVSFVNAKIARKYILMTFPKAKIWKCHFFCVPLHSISDYTEALLKEKMCDYVRHEVCEMLKHGEEIKP